MKKYIPHIIAAVLFVLVVFLMFRGCGQPADGTTTVIHDTIPGDPYPVDVPRYIPRVSYIDTGSTVYVPGTPLPTDTAAILRDYLVARYYNDTLKNDTSLLLVVRDTVRANRITSRGFTFQNRRPIAVNTTIIQPPAKETYLRVYAGAFAGYSPKTFRFAVGPEITLILRPGFIGRYGYDIAGNGHFVSAGWKISFRKKK